MRAPLLSGFCTPGNPEDSHHRCAGCGCGCHVPVVADHETDAVTGVLEAVERLQGEQDALVEACTDPQATDLAELLDCVRTARTELAKVERDVELACAKAMLGDYAETATLRVERYRSPERKEWDHEAWQRDVRAKAVQAAGLKGAQGVLTADGEVLPATVLYDLVAMVESVHSAGAPKTSKTAGLRHFGLDPADYCTTSPGAWHVKVLRMAEETAQDGAA